MARGYGEGNKEKRQGLGGPWPFSEQIALESWGSSSQNQAFCSGPFMHKLFGTPNLENPEHSFS